MSEVFLPTLLMSLSLFLLSAVLTAGLRQVTLRAGLMDHPGERSSHRLPTPIGGGLAIVVVFYSGCVLLYAWGELSPGELAALAMSLPVALTGFADDWRHIDFRWRIVLHFTAALGALYCIWPAFMELNEGAGTVLLIAAGAGVSVALVWLLNLYNFMDGIDGLAGAQNCFVTAAGGILLASAGDHSLALLSLVLLSASAGFLLWNLPPARIFMGDAGSAFSGMVIGLLFLISLLHGSLSPWSWLLLLGVFLADATLTLVRRILSGQRWYEGHRQHAYQILSRRWAGHGRTTAALMLMNVFWLFPLAILADSYPAYGVYFVLAGLLPLVLAFYWLGAGQEEEPGNFEKARS